MPARRGRRPLQKSATSCSRSQPWSDEWSPQSAREAECNVCRELLVEPARLPCGHRFCVGCVKSAVEKSTGSCPLCRVRCAGWLRRATLHRNLIDERLWKHIQTSFPEQLAARLRTSTANDDNDNGAGDDHPEVVHRNLCAPGEIRNEYEIELKKAKEENRLLNEKYSKESEKLIRKLQEQEKIQLESEALKIQNDEKFAKELAVSLNRSSRNQIAPDTVSKPFYNHLGKLSNGCKSNTLDNFIITSSEKQNAINKSTPSLTATSPELISTANRCGRFLKNFLNGKLWGFNMDTINSSHSGNSSKIEPKIWEPEKNCPNTDHELSVNSGVVIHRNTTSSNTTKLSSRKLAILPKTDEKKYCNFKMDSDMESEDSISQELRYFKPIQTNPITRFNGKLIKSLATRKHIDKERSLNNVEIDSLLSANALKKLRGIEITNLSFSSAFVCLLRVPKSCVKECEVVDFGITTGQTPTKRNITNKIKNHKTPKNDLDLYRNNDSKNSSKQSSNKNNDFTNVTNTPRKKNSIKAKTKKKSQSCVKDNKVLNLRSRVPERLRRSLSFDNISINNNTNKTHVLPSDIKILINSSTNSHNVNNNRVLRSNMYLEKCSDLIGNSHHKSGSKNSTNSKTKYKTDNVFNQQNGNIIKSKDIKNFVLKDDVNFSLNDVDQSVVEEQKRIEEILIQEKKDLALAKKLQRQLGGYFVNTGYTLRTATKRQASLTELLPPSKNMRI